MRVIVTENWSDRRYQRGVAAQRGWVVTGVDDEDQAIAQVPEAAAGTTFVLDSRLEAEQPYCERDQGPRAFHVLSVYTRPEGPGDIGSDPLDMPLRYSWTPGSRSGRTDIDAKKRPLLNAAGVPFANGAEREKSVQLFTVTRNESQFDAAKSIAYTQEGGSINRDSVVVPNIGRLFPGQMLIRGYHPTHDWDERSRYVECAYVFELLGGSVQDDDGLWDGFKFRIPNVSLQGWAKDPVDNVVKLGRLVNAYGEPLSEPVPLDTTGVPKNRHVKVQLAMHSRLEPVPAPEDKRIPFSIIELTGEMQYLKYARFPDMPFSGLGLF